MGGLARACKRVSSARSARCGISIWKGDERSWSVERCDAHTKVRLGYGGEARCGEHSHSYRSEAMEARRAVVSTRIAMEARRAGPNGTMGPCSCVQGGSAARAATGGGGRCVYECGRVDPRGERGEGRDEARSRPRAGPGHGTTAVSGGYVPARRRGTRVYTWLF